jgi:hypothetical protein
LITRAAEADAVVVVDGRVVVVEVVGDDEMVVTIRNVAPIKRITMMNTTARDGW